MEVSDGSPSIAAILWRVAENKSLPLNIKLAARCKRCGCDIQVIFLLNDMRTKPTRMQCALCASDDLRISSAAVVTHRHS
jgi:hypothetical protein